MAFSKISLEEQINNNKIKIDFKPRKAPVLIGVNDKKEIEEHVSRLDGFENLKLCLFEECVPVYKEERFYNGVNRWLEIEINIHKDMQKTKVS